MVGNDFAVAANAELESDWELAHASAARVSLRGWDYQLSLAASYITVHYTGLGISEGLQRPCSGIQEPPARRAYPLSEKGGSEAIVFPCAKAEVIKSLLLGSVW